MDAEIEEGELIESDDEDNKNNFQHRKKDDLSLKLGFSAASVWHGVPVSGGGCELGYMETLTNSIVKSRRIPEGLPTSESENENEESECSEDERPSKKKPVYYASAKSTAAGSAHANPDPAATKFGFRKPQKNNIWATVIQDQILSNDLMGWSGLEQAIESDRNVESYNYIKAKEMSHSAPTSLSDLQPTDHNTQSDLVPDISEMETFGTDSTKTTNDKRLGNRDCDPGRPWLKRGHNGDPRSSVHSRLGLKSLEESNDFGHIKVTSSDQPSAVADELMRILREPESVKETFDRVVQTIGVEAALKFLSETEDIEKNGGLMIKNGYRRRTPGGVYLFLVKNGVTKEQSDVIFQSQRDDIKRHKKLWRGKKNWTHEKNQRTTETALGLSGLEASGDSVSEGSRDAFPYAVTASGDVGLVKADQPLEMEEEEEDGSDPFDSSINIELG